MRNKILWSIFLNFQFKFSQHDVICQFHFFIFSDSSQIFVTFSTCLEVLGGRLWRIVASKAGEVLEGWKEELVGRKTDILFFVFFFSSFLKGNFYSLLFFYSSSLSFQSSSNQ